MSARVKLKLPMNLVTPLWVVLSLGTSIGKGDKLGPRNRA